LTRFQNGLKQQLNKNNISNVSLWDKTVIMQQFASKPSHSALISTGHQLQFTTAKSLHN
jgi:hypothetical protein